jgi:ABC-2 type transport system permease protein
MNPNSEAVIPKANFRYFRSPQTVVSRFVVRNSIRSAALWALIFGVYVASKGIGYAVAYPTVASRIKIAASLGNNAGFNAILGAPHDLGTITGEIAWNTLIVMTIIGSVWAYLKATKTFRGEEDAGRWELLLSGQTTAKMATINALAGLSFSLVVMYVVTAVTFVAIGKDHNVDYSVMAGMFFALAATAGAAMFMAIGAVVSQLMPTRSRAAGVSTAILGVFFLVRAAADATNLHWLLNLTPIGWIDKLQPLYGSQPIWLLPIIAFIAVLVVITVVLAGRRDLGDSTFADKDSSKPHNRLLNTPIGLAVRLNRGVTISWLVGIFIATVFYSFLTKAATTLLSDSSGLKKDFSAATSLLHTNLDLIWLGVTFYLMMMLIMAYVASAVGAVRKDEADGYVDNLLVCEVSRMRWLWGRISLIVGGIVLAGLVVALGAWLGIANEATGISFHQLLVAGVNALVPAVFILGLGIFALGFAPRLTTVIAYSAIAWSFLISILKSGLHLNHWVLDTSILQHVNLAPVANPVWKTAIIIVCLGILLAVVGALRFNNRDLQSE